MAKLTKRTADLATAGAKVTAIWDEELRGFGLRVYPNGRKVYVVKCRIKGQQRFITLGSREEARPGAQGADHEGAGRAFPQGACRRALQAVDPI